MPIQGGMEGAPHVGVPIYGGAWQGPLPGDAQSGCANRKRSEAVWSLPIGGSVVWAPPGRGSNWMHRQETTGGGVSMLM